MRPSTQRLRTGLRTLAPAIYRRPVPLDPFRVLPVGTNLPPYELPIPTKSELGWREAAVGMRWGGPDENIWLHGEAHVPADWQGLLGDDYPVVARLQPGAGLEEFFGWPEGLLYVNGRVQQGINRHHTDVLLRDEDVRTGRVVLDARVWSGLAPHDHRIEAADVALLDRRMERLVHLLAAGADLVDALDERDPLLYGLAEALERAHDALDMRDTAHARLEESARGALVALERRLAELRERYVPAQRPTVTAVGHGHLDVAWLWQTRHTREKTARTFSIATALMEQYPDYVFLATTPQVFAWLKTDYPELYDRAKRRVLEGRFEAAGAMWLEADCNLVSGESLVRQILYGQRFLREELGREYDALWLPDAFGYSAALPQIMLRAGLKTFMTTKMSWNETNRIPADTFWWRGLDGSAVLAHFITTPSLIPLPPLDKVDTYNGAMNVPSVLGLWDRYRQRAVSQEVLLSFGRGDGGAGPTRQYLEQARAMRLLPGMPELRLGRADEYFARLRERAAQAGDVPTWDGELYLEYHRGTYTTQAWLKRAHRQNEARLLLAELLHAWLSTRTTAQAPDWQGALDDAWRTLLLHEFHDILPGSSIGPVYADAREAMANLERTLESMIADGLARLAASAGGEPGGMLLLNPSPFSQRAVIELRGAEASLARALAVGGQGAQAIQEAGAGDVLLETDEIPALGFRILGSHQGAAHGAAPVEAARAGERTLENAFFALRLDDDGEIVSFVDKRVAGGRELAQPGRRLNHFEAYDDRPPNFDAWDIDADFERKPFPLGPARIEPVESGALRATLLVRREILSSVVEQRISVYRSIPRVDFATRIEWHDAHVLLKVAFPLDLRVRRATSETPFGAVERPTHRNTSWDQAQFETCAHRWVDLSEAGYGVSLLNDGRYGHDVRDATIRLTLLRSPTDPDPRADQGLHEVTYALFPHPGDWREGGTVAAAYGLNRPLRVVSITEAAVPGSRGQNQAAIFTATPASVVVEAVKRPAEGEGIILRVYEAHGARVRARLISTITIREIVECDLLERTLDERSPAFSAWKVSRYASHDVPLREGDAWSFELRPWEVRTFRVVV